MSKLKRGIFVVAVALWACFALAQVTLLAQSNFSSRDGVLRQYSHSDSEGVYENGAYRLTIHSNSTAAWALSSIRFSNVRVQADIAKINPISGDGVGLICRSGEYGRYLFWLDAEDSRAAILRYFRDEWTVLNRRRIPSSVTLYRDNRYNTVAADCNGKDLLMYVNGQVVASAQDDALPFGYTGIWLEKYNYIGTSTAYFDNFYVWSFGR